MTDKTLKDIFLDELRLCEVGPGQTVAVLSEGDLLRDYAEYSLSAASELGAQGNRCQPAGRTGRGRE